MVGNSASVAKQNVRLILPYLKGYKLTDGSFKSIPVPIAQLDILGLALLQKLLPFHESDPSTLTQPLENLQDRSQKA